MPAKLQASYSRQRTRKGGPGTVRPAVFLGRGALASQPTPRCEVRLGGAAAPAVGGSGESAPVAAVGCGDQWSTGYSPPCGTYVTKWIGAPASHRLLRPGWPTCCCQHLRRASGRLGERRDPGAKLGSSGNRNWCLGRPCTSTASGHRASLDLLQNKGSWSARRGNRTPMAVNR
jgi:hypothetical protein